MKLTTPQIVWHSKQPVFTADFHKNGPKWRLATGGADNDIKIWKVKNEEDGVKIIFLSSLSRHTKAVNVVRFSPNGEYLASAGDDNVLILWTQDVGTQLAGNNLLSDTVNKENWTVVKIFRGHLEDIYDLCWSCDSHFIITGSVDNSAIVWDVLNGKQVSALKESRQYVQGVSWDPLGKVVVTLSNDRNLRIYGVDSKFKCLHSVSKMSSPNSMQHESDSRQWRMWIDERLNSFFRRLSFTPDGLFLIVPAGRYEDASQSRVSNATYVFSRNNWSRPVLQLPGPDKPTVVVKCCPVQFELKLKPENSLISLPYRLVYAVASLDSILLYDTQHAAPFAHVSNIHYSAITDLAWSNDGEMLIVTSSDCYCSVIIFEPNELGIHLESSLTEQETKQVTKLSEEACSQVEQISTETVASVPAYKEAVSPCSKQRRIRPTMISTVPNMQTNSTDDIISQTESLAENESDNTVTDKKVPRRVQLITLTSFKSSSTTDNRTRDKEP